MPWGKIKRTVDSHPELLKKDMEIKEAWSVFNERTRGHFSPHYLDNIKNAVSYLILETEVRAIAAVDFATLSRFRNTYLDRGRTACTINHYLTNITALLQYFGLTVEVPYVTDRKGNEAKITASLLTAKEFERLLEVTPSEKYRAGEALLYYQGIRIGNRSGEKGYPLRGLLGLNWSDINFEDGMITITGKGGKRYVRPLHMIAEKYLRELKETGNRGFTNPEDPVFVSNLRNRLRYRTFYAMLAKYMKIAGIPKEKRHPHAFRHTRGTIATKSHGIRFAQGVLCQDNIASTLKYEHIVDEEYLKELIRPDKAQEERIEVELKKCPNCSAELTPNRKICDCGYDFTIYRCSKCGKNLEKNANFCGHCGFRLGVPKPECVCGQELRSNYKICPHCGKPTAEILRKWDQRSFELWSQSSNTPLPDEANTFPVKPDEAIRRFQNSPPKSLVAENMFRGPCKRYDVQIVASKEELIPLLRDDWELVKETAQGEFILRKSAMENNGEENSTN